MKSIPDKVPAGYKERKSTAPALHCCRPPGRNMVVSRNMFGQKVLSTDTEILEQGAYPGRDHLSYPLLREAGRFNDSNVEVAVFKQSEGGCATCRPASDDHDVTFRT